MVVNAQHMKAVPGRKTDVTDAEWIADLLQHGLLKASYIPDKAQRELREMVGYRKNLIKEQAAELNRLQKILEAVPKDINENVQNQNGIQPDFTKTHEFSLKTAEIRGFWHDSVESDVPVNCRFFAAVWLTE